MDYHTLVENLSRFVPSEAAPILAEWTLTLKIDIQVKPPRKSKRGDFRPAHKGKTAKITINRNLHPLSFLVTLVHEFAHAYVWKQHGNRVAPHGPEWQAKYQQLMMPFLEMGIFPSEIHAVLSKHMEAPASSSCFDMQLTKALDSLNSSDFQYLDSIAVGTIFQLQHDTRWFQKKQKLRKNYLCLNLGDGRQYRISPMAKIAKIKSS